MTSATAANWQIGPWQQPQRCHKTFPLQRGSDICHVLTRANTKAARHIPTPAQKNSLGDKRTHFLPEEYRRSGPHSRGRPPVPSQCCLHALCWNREHHKLLHRESKFKNTTTLENLQRWNQSAQPTFLMGRNKVLGFLGGLHALFCQEPLGNEKSKVYFSISLSTSWAEVHRTLRNCPQRDSFAVRIPSSLNGQISVH